jgi:hypothetical protein
MLARMTPHARSDVPARLSLLMIRDICTSLSKAAIDAEAAPGKLNFPAEIRIAASVVAWARAVGTAGRYERESRPARMRLASESRWRLESQSRSRSLARIRRTPTVLAGYREGCRGRP